MYCVHLAACLTIHSLMKTTNRAHHTIEPNDQMQKQPCQENSFTFHLRAKQNQELKEKRKKNEFKKNYTNILWKKNAKENDYRIRFWMKILNSTQKKEKYSACIVLSFSRYRRLIVPDGYSVINLKKSVIHEDFAYTKNVVRKDSTIIRKMLQENSIFISQRKLFEVEKAFTSLCVIQYISAYFYLQFPSVTWCLIHSKNSNSKQNSFIHSRTDSNCK